MFAQLHCHVKLVQEGERRGSNLMLYLLIAPSVGQLFLKSPSSCTSLLAMAVEGFHEPLKYQTWALKVSIHCDGCKREVKKALQHVEGVYEIRVDAQQHKVVVTGDVAAETLIRKLARMGKHAELWSEKKLNENGDGNNNKSKNMNGSGPKEPSFDPESSAETADKCGKAVDGGKTGRNANNANIGGGGDRRGSVALREVSEGIAGGCMIPQALDSPVINAAHLPSHLVSYSSALPSMSHGGAFYGPLQVQQSSYTCCSAESPDVCSIM